MNTQKIILTIWALAAGAGLTSCHYLDQKPDNLLTEDQIWQTRANAEGYLHNIYSYIANTNGDDWASAGGSDESSVCYNTTDVRQMANGNWNAASGYFYTWPGYYAGIRKSIVFEQNIDKVPNSQLSMELKAQYKAESRFLRGFMYWMLLRQYGPFVKVDGLIARDADFHQYPRAPFDTCVAYIDHLMDQAMVDLPPKWDAASNYGRPTRGSCLAIKVKTGMLAASELWNGNPAFADFKNPDGTPLASTTFDANRWKVAADRAKTVIDGKYFKLFTNLDNGGTTFDPYLSVRDLFLTNWNDEIIFANLNWWTWGFTKCASPGPGGYGMYNPTQNLVDAFAMANGKDISDPTSGYVETGFAQSNGTTTWSHKAGDWNMYANREPRFYANILYNGRPTVPAPTVDDKNFYSSPANADGRGRTEFYFSGKAGQANNSGNITGYLPLKRISANDNIRTDQVAYHGPWIFLRYAEILLDYAEALNEYDPANGDIVTYLNMVRTRAGLPGIETLYPGAVGNKEEMRKHILKERQVELCFESDRYFTLTRRLLSGKDANLNIYCLDVNANDNGQGFAFTGLYKRTLFQKRHWENKMYLFPIHQGDIERNRALTQNPGWK
ncbi:RagB/SusD family nutrient uptake outer membrane protein [Chitinophaga horti]|uniref:RagB/SusD family nutrient uptake outer membrane protein n=1 Tax=Chitinophaga horti TaxID=2920382 RepID=A0ABY6IXK8_9BACT|nr:RagB/SusD family nutrient uptake outer membrane protein [Chitinophaga horti]UYQ92121.1 RagB/SusD family nutrient uptake outer membrane protein [Chitinophaga horti]